MGVPRLTLIVARARNGVIGRDGGLPWNLPDDLAFFRQATLGHPILMGRTTHESIGRPLPGRRNLVLTRDPGRVPPGCETVASLDEALARCAGEEEIFVIGGAQLYALALPRAQRWLLTAVDADPAGEVSLPGPQAAEWEETGRRHHPRDPRHEYAFDWVELRRRDPSVWQDRGFE